MATIQQRTNKDGDITFRAQVRLKGYPPQTATFKRKTDAKKWATDTESNIRAGRHFSKSESKRHTVSDLIKRYIAQVLPNKPKSQYKQTKQLLWWSEQIGVYTLANTTPALIAEYRDQLLQEITPRGKLRSNATTNRYLAALSHAFTTAIKEWGWLETNPVLKVTKTKEPRGRVRFLSEDERSRLLKSCQQNQSKYLYLIVVLALSTGARRMEILGLHWNDVDFNRGVITLHQTKNGERRLLPIAGHALNLLKEHAKVRLLHTDLVFPGKNLKTPIDIRTPWETALKQAEIADFRFHDLRHSSASYLAMNGATLAEIAEVLGHKTLQMVKRYAHLSEAHTAKVVARMNEQIFGSI